LPKTFAQDARRIEGVIFRCAFQSIIFRFRATVFTAFFEIETHLFNATAGSVVMFRIVHAHLLQCTRGRCGRRRCRRGRTEDVGRVDAIAFGLLADDILAIDVNRATDRRVSARFAAAIDECRTFIAFPPFRFFQASFRCVKFPLGWFGTRSTTALAIDVFRGYTEFSETAIVYFCTRILASTFTTIGK
jgi:hypothetical protein